LEAKIKSMCLSHLIETSKGETRDAIQASKFLLDAPWVKEENKRGRPSKVEIDNEIKSQAEMHQRIQEDLDRISVVVDAVSEDINTEAAVIARLEIQRSLGRVEGKLDQIITGMTMHESLDKDRFLDVHQELDTLSRRTSGLEKKIWVASGAVALVAFFLSHFPFALLWK
jgi:hypothetical protein